MHDTTHMVAFILIIFTDIWTLVKNWLLGQLFTWANMYQESRIPRKRKIWYTKKNLGRQPNYFGIPRCFSLYERTLERGKILVYQEKFSYTKRKLSWNIFTHINVFGMYVQNILTKPCSGNFHLSDCRLHDNSNSS